MTNLLDFPNEILISIFEILATIDLQSLVVSQLTNRQFHTLIQDAIYNVQNLPVIRKKTGSEETEINPIWKTMFKGLFNSQDCFTPEERQRMAYLSLYGDFTLPFRRLPWAQTAQNREAFIRPEASWRNLSLTFGRAPITHLDVVKSYSSNEGDAIDYYQVDLPEIGMTMGLFYDILLCDNATYGTETGSWALIVGRRLRSYDVLAEYECFIADDRNLVDYDEETRQSAVLYVRGSTTVCDLYDYEYDEFDEASHPKKTDAENWVVASSQAEQRLLPWQGPTQNFIFTGYFD